MSFLQPYLLAALPVAALPIIIHLINQRRYQTTRWAAMMFLLAANRMSRGYARIRQWLILAARVLAVAALVVVLGRPLAGGWLGVTAGGRPDTTVVILDRSPSMAQGGAGVVGSKLDTGRAQLARSLQTLGSARWVLIESGTNTPRELASADALLKTPSAEGTSAASDLPGMLQAAYDYVKANRTGRTEIWVCSDLRENDWNAADGRWQTLREGFRDLPQGVRFHLLAYPRDDPGNLSVRVREARRQGSGDGAEVVVSLSVAREGGAAGAADKESVPVRFEVEGASSEVKVELSGGRAELKDHRIPVDKARLKGFGRVSIPADANPADNDYYFTFAEPEPRLSVVVAEEPQAARPLVLAASIAPDPAWKSTAEAVAPGQLDGVEWDRVSLLLWQAPLPEGDAARLVRSFVDRGGQVVFFPPAAPGGAEFLGAKWTAWAEGKGDQGTPVEGWRGDQDLLAQTLSGAPLPVGRLEVRRWCGLSGELTPLATLKGGAPLLARLSTTAGGVSFCATTPAPRDSSLASEGVVLYVLVQRALAAGAASLGATRQLVAGDPAGENPALWRRLAGDVEGVAVSTDAPLHRGVYAANDRLLAVNRPAAEDGAKVLTGPVVAGLFRGLDFARVDDQAGNLGALIQEVWRLFLVAMLAAMVAEAALCLPKAAAARTAGAFANPAAAAASATSLASASISGGGRS